ncbi:MAG TPA: GH92 family glycosyl hydrolase [Solirubrobacteraceae bacterium]|nr:GH92 family glycosyl hydrolase [Solirubrobacteraceae bacterium]
MQAISRILGPLAAAAMLALAAPAQAAPSSDFSSSLEPGDPQPAWTNTAERASGVSGPRRSGIPGNVTDRVVAVRASGENTGGGEVKENLVDGSAETKWLVFASTGWVELELAEPVAVVHYALTSANDAQPRDPRDWTLQGSNDGQTWTTLDTQTDQVFDERFQKREYRFANTTAYRHYRLDITRNSGTNIVQLAEIELSNGDTSPPPPSDMRTIAGAGPRGGYNAKAGAGWTGLRALEYAGQHTAEGRGYSYNKVFDVDVQVNPETELSYLIYPRFITDDLSYPSTYVAVDLAFTDGTFLSELGAEDQHGEELSPTGQGRAKTLYTNQWNFKRSQIGRVAAGKTIDRILVAYDNPDGPADFQGWVDDITIDGAPEPRDRSRPSDWVDTRRGTNSSSRFSRGNNVPATAVPHGFNFWTPVTNANTLSWLYEYQFRNNAENLPQLEAFSLSHQPSPWMGDRQTFQVVPFSDSIPPEQSALTFRHANEVASPHRYAVKFDNGIGTEIAPTDHAALFRFTFPGDSGGLNFRNVGARDRWDVNISDGVLTGWTETRSGLSNGATRMFIYATFDQPMVDGQRFNARTVNMRIATSLISLEQAKHNLELELSDTDTIESVSARAQQLWDRKLGVIEVEGATEDQLTTLYSNLYRLSLYPNSGHENTGTAASPQWEHAVQSTDSDTPPPSTPERTGAPIRPGKVYVNNGFWDTYRTAWSAYSLFDAGTAGELVDGFVQQYRDGGWISRWSSPGYANLMTGTSSDVSFADAHVKGIKGFDVRDAYDAALRNATVAPPEDDPYNTQVGRKGLIESIFLGWTPSRVSEGVSWGLEGAINDFGIANSAAVLADDRQYDAADRRRYREEAEYFRSRAQNYVNMFDPAIRFFQGRASDGTWKSSPEEYDPRVWGHEHDYTETDGWNFAFHVPHDGQGLANLYGGRDRLAAKLDEFFATPETAKFVGSYGGVIHEMTEARDVRMGQWGFSNQVSHHIPYMYDYAGQPWKTQAKVREALRRMYVGSEIGQGYAGDEDNGETSAWYLFSALGFYPLQVGSPYYAVGSPLFKRATVHLANGRDLVVEAPANSRRNVYVQGLELNGRRWDQAYLRHEDLANGGRLEFDMGHAPSNWGSGRADAPPSLTRGDERPEPLTDLTGGDDAGPLFDNTSGTEAAGSEAAWEFPARERVQFYTLTSGKAEGADPGDWVVEGSRNGQSWTVLDSRRGEQFRWRSQTRAFKLSRTDDYSAYRIRFARPATVAEVELLDYRPVSASPVVVEVGSGAAAGAGESATVPVKVANYGETPASGEVTLTAPAGFTVTPGSAAYGPLAPGESKTVEFSVAVPPDAAPGSYSLQVSATTGEDEPVTARGSLQVVGDTIAFAAGSDEERPWLFDADGSQLNNGGRFADNGTYFTYRFTLPAGVTGGTLTLDMGNQFVVSSSLDNEFWTEHLRETREIRDLSNRDEYELQLNDLRGGGRTFYLRIQDSKPTDGWGGWVAGVEVVATR